MSDDLMWRSAVEQAALVRDRQVSALELVDAAIARIEATRGLNAVVHDDFEAARERARTARLGDGPLAGVPFLLKDLGEPQEGKPERMGSRALRDHIATETAWSVQRYEDAGMIVVGRTATPEFGNHCATDGTANPWALDRSPGGSSGGSAACVAAGVVAAASGSDGTGSIRVPAACCGLVGLKPRRGRSSFAPGAGQALDGLVNKHALTRTVLDTAVLLDVIAGAAPGDPYGVGGPLSSFVSEVGADPGKLVVMNAPGPPFPGTVDPRVQAVADAAARGLEALGHTLVTDVPQIDAEAVVHAISVVHAVDNARTFAFVAEHLGRSPRADELDPVTWGMVREGKTVSGIEHADAVDTLHAQTRLAAAAFTTADVLLAPTLNVLPPHPGDLSSSRGTVEAFFEVETAATGWTALANVTGWAAISLPLGHVDGLPVGVQLMAPGEEVLLRVATQLEDALPWSERRPPV
ncbi:amidase [Baekduia sp. Peel2402]|uniref:amidase n=1 Tax=Baekduia sp. Peel2402 TaxID=3458296 RepID=UPI00403EB54A